MTTLLKTLPRARKEVTSTAPVVSVSTTTSESLMDTCERIMADPNLRTGVRLGWDGMFGWEAAYGVDAWSPLAAMAARTQRIRLGTLLTPLPWRRPGKVASQVATWTSCPAAVRFLAVGVGGQGAAGCRSARCRRWLSSAQPSGPLNQRACPTR